jgi:hypothetical protein
MIGLRRNRGDYGGKGPFRLPADHVAAIRVPKGGSCCQNCMFVDAKNHACKEPHYILWNGGDPSLPKDLALDEICSDWFDWPGSGSAPKLHPNPDERYFVWVVDRQGKPLAEGPYGPHTLDAGKTYARISATEGEHDRVVTLGANPNTLTIVRHYKARTGERVV